MKKKLKPLLRRIHGSTRHSGKVPRRSRSAIRFKRELDRLKDELQQRVRNEEFEEAARLRDQIRKMEQELHEGGV